MHTIVSGAAGPLARVFGIASLAVCGFCGPPAIAGTLYTHAPVTLHGGPGDGFPVRGSLQPRVKINVLWCNSATEWCLVEHDTGEGWLPLANLVTTSNAPDPARAEAPGTGGESNSKVSSSDNNAGHEHHPTVAGPAIAVNGSAGPPGLPVNGAGSTDPTVKLN